jgi:AcrR family transcriptional regulator
MPDDGPKRMTRHTRAETIERILDAALELFATRNPSEVTVREVAAEAGVTHALVHQYIGTKQDLFNAVMERVSTQRVAVVAASPSLNDALKALLQQVLENRVHTQAQVRSAIDGVDYVAPPLETGAALVALARATAASDAELVPVPDDVDPRVVLAAVTAIATGMSVIDSWLYPIFQLDLDDRSEVNRQLAEIVDYLLNLVLASEMD